jgi:acetylornithine deacetylase/succinyl-diaminopimelate desuccinylase-like protein
LQETDGYFTARGSIDDKAMASSFVSVLGQLKQEGFKPSRDIILALTTDEERGDVPSNGAYWIVKNKPELVKAEFGINEGGGGELRAGKPVLHRIQVAEKMYTTYELEAHDVGGHSSIPTKSNPIYALTAALDRLGAYQFPVKLADVTQTYFARSAPLATGQLAEDMRAVGTGHPDQASIDRLSAMPFYNAQLRTTCVATMVNAGHAENALPQSAKATVNCRILPHDDPADIDRQLKQVIGNDKISVRYVNQPLASPASPLSGDLVKTVDTLTQQMWNVPVIPAMSTGATDSRFMRNAGIPMYGVSGLFTEPADYRAHGLDERIEIARLYDGREFLYRLVKQLAE